MWLYSHAVAEQRSFLSSTGTVKEGNRRIYIIANKILTICSSYISKFKTCNKFVHSNYLTLFNMQLHLYLYVFVCKILVMCVCKL